MVKNCKLVHLLYTGCATKVRSQFFVSQLKFTDEKLLRS